ncbi:MAG: Stk1 family PASTA domain-containing Ser/Thr kinase [Cellulomonadaceae bacterium]|nr:Stk1 family PASTA domain-containing Ser/Thr kinase [Cellulomonadaceae bacterium]
MADNTPRVLAGRYEVGQLIGRGGMAEVHIGHDARLGRTVAIKVLRSDLARDPSFLARFRREAQSAAALNHPAIVSVYDTGEDTHVDPATGAELHIPYIVMEYVEGHTVRDILHDGAAVPIDEAIEITAGVLSALEYSHHAGIIHRDIKPANVMITPTGAVKVMDFGIARAVADSAATMTQTQAVIGTAQYLSPEQARGETVDARSDLYSTGCLLFELLTGRPPFVGDSPVAVAYQHVGQEPQKPSDFASDVPETLDRINIKALAKDRDLRYATAAEFRADLEAALHGGVVGAPAIGGAVDPGATQVLGAGAAGATVAMSALGAAGATDGTMVMDAAAAEAAGTAGDIPSWGPLGQPIATPAEGNPILAEEEDRKKRRKQAIIWASIIGGLLLIAGLITWFVLSGGDDSEPEAGMAIVPTITAGMTQDHACSLITDAQLVCDPQVDDDSNEPEGQFTRQDPQGDEEVAVGTTVHVFFSGGPNTLGVPDIAGMTQEQAQEALEAEGLVWGTVSAETSVDVPRDSVIRTDPAIGVAVQRGARINIVVSNGMVDLPDVTGQHRDEARVTLENLGLHVDTHEVTSTQPEGTVVTQSPNAGQVSQGSRVALNIAIPAATPTVTVPNIVGQQWNPNLLQGLNASVTFANSSSIPAGAVISTNPPAGTTVNQGSSIVVTVSNGPAAQPPAGGGGGGGTDGGGSDGDH